MSIATKVTLVVTLLAGLLLVGSGYAGLVIQERDAHGEARRRARMMAAALSSAAMLELESSRDFGRLTDIVAQQTSPSMIFFGRDGRAVAPASTEEDPLVSQPIRRVIESGKPAESFFHHEGRTAYVYRVPLRDGQQQVAGALELRLDVSPAGMAQWTSIGTLIAGGLLLLFSALVGLFSRRTIGRPIDQLMTGMDHVIRGDLTHALPLDRSDEIGRIAYRFNEMTARLRAAQDEITRNARAQLRLEGKLRQTEKLATIGQLSAEIAHEVGTPLNVIGGRAHKLRRRADSPGEVKKNARIIADQVSRITKIIQQLLDLARATPRQEELSLTETVNDAVAFLEYQTEQAGVRVRCDTDDDLPPLTGDPDALQQVVLNLLLNAIQSMPNGGEVIVRARRTHRRKGGLDLAPPQSYAVLSVEDRGVGIPDEHRDRIFDPFFSTKAKGEGSGLGLTVVHGIVKEHDGWIDVEPAIPHGTVFHVYLPLESPRPAIEAQRAQPPAPEAADAEPALAEGGR